MTDFFISYTSKDQAWAEWIAFALEEVGFTTKIQAWDFRPGANFVLEMQDAADKAERTVLVLSPDYLDSKMAAAEWAAAFAQDPMGQDRRIVPVMVHECQPTGLLPTIVQIRIHDRAEDEARRLLLEGVERKRAKPAERPRFPGAVPAPHGEKRFPGTAETSRARRSVIPSLDSRPSELDVRRFAKQGFETIRNVFQDRLKQAELEESRIATEFTEVTATEFRAEIFVDGKSKSECRISLGNMFGPDSITYGHGHMSGNSANEILSPTNDGGLAFSATMSMGLSAFEKMVDLKRMRPEEAAEYLWSMFTKRLGH